MVRFHELGFKSFEDYANEFFSSLLPSNKTYAYFVDWRKIRQTISAYVEEISLLNSLTRVANSARGQHLERMLMKYPRVVEVIPMLIAERAKRGQIDIFDPDLEEFITLDFSAKTVCSESARRIAMFCGKVGILNLFAEIKDAHDYLLGVEVGLDSNTRKNRSGHIFEEMVRAKVSKFLPEGWKVIQNDPDLSLYDSAGKSAAKAKTHDLVLYFGQRPRIVIECNFYNTTGSKPISIAESYPDMEQAAAERELTFVWVTDGPAWRQMREPITRAMQRMSWILNFRMLHCLATIIQLHKCGSK